MKSTPSHGSVVGAERRRIQGLNWPWRGKASIKIRLREVVSGWVGPLHEAEVED